MSDLYKELGLNCSPLQMGKKLGSYIWVHRAGLECIEWKYKALIQAVMDHNFCVVRLSLTSSDFQLSSCPNFDSLREPRILGHKSYTVINGVPVLTKCAMAKTDNHLIFHHKHLFVPPDYLGFDIAESMSWSREWKNKIKRNREKTSRIGRVAGWQSVLSECGLL